MDQLFRKFAVAIAEPVVTSRVVLLSPLILVVGALGIPLFDFSNIWQLTTTTGVSVAAFLMVCLIQNTQYREVKAVQLKPDELSPRVDRTHA